MITALIDHPLFLVAVTAIVTYLSKIAWDRWGSTTSRVTHVLCEQNRKACVADLTANISIKVTDLLGKIEKHALRLNGGDQCFSDIENHLEKNDRKMKLILLTLQEICRCQGIDCDSVTREMLRKELLE